MSPFQFTDYRTYYRDEVSARKKLDSSINFQNMSDAMRIQKPFLSKVVNGHSHLTKDHLYLANEYLRLSAEESDFIDLIHEYQTSSLKVRQEKLRKEIELEQRKHLRTDKHIRTTSPASQQSDSIREYYLDPSFQLVHVAMSIERYRRDIKLLASDLMFPIERVVKAVGKLEDLGILKREGSALKVVAHDLHLPRNSKEYMAWNSQLRAAAMQRCQNLPSDEAYGFSVVFSTDEPTRREIQEMYLKFVKEVQRLTSGSEEKNLYQLNFDLFNWNHPIVASVNRHK